MLKQFVANKEQKEVAKAIAKIEANKKKRRKKKKLQNK
jgi:hypothetical protein